MPMSPVSGKYIFYYGLRTSILHTNKRDNRKISFEMIFIKYFADGIST